MRSAVILSGGKSSRFNYADKQFININGKPLLFHVIENISGVVDEVIVATRDEEQRKKIEQKLDFDDVFDIKITIDDVCGFGPLAGILSGLKATCSDYSVVLACDMPNLNKNVIKLLFATSEGFGASIPMWENGLIEPLCAVYRNNSMVEATKEAIKNKKRDVTYPISKISDAVYVPVEILKMIDPELKTFFNINGPKDLEDVCTGVNRC